MQFTSCKNLEWTNLKCLGITIFIIIWPENIPILSTRGLQGVFWFWINQENFSTTISSSHYIILWSKCCYLTAYFSSILTKLWYRWNDTTLSRTIVNPYLHNECTVVMDRIRISQWTITAADELLHHNLNIAKFTSNILRRVITQLQLNVMRQVCNTVYRHFKNQFKFHSYKQFRVLFHIGVD